MLGSVSKPSMTGIPKSLPAMQVKERASKAEPTVKQVKILKDADKAGEAKAKSAKSKGFAFVELTDHEHALCALRQLNNNPLPFGAQCSPLALRLQASVFARGWRIFARHFHPCIL